VCEQECGNRRVVPHDIEGEGGVPPLRGFQRRQVATITTFQRRQLAKVEGEAAAAVASEGGTPRHGPEMRWDEMGWDGMG
jgi:hypothetical protein